MDFKHPPIPPACPDVFRGGIDHPNLWLWDSWTLQTPAGPLHLYCLALSRTHSDGRSITPPERNDFTFHIRHFTSDDGGQTWRDRGVATLPQQIADGADARNVWSGSALRLHDGQTAFGFTGIRDCGKARSFLQTICVATAPAPGAEWRRPASPISCPLRDYDAITATGYYLGPKDELGSRDGEEGGPIMAWRDPFLFHMPNGELRAVWSAKLSPAVPAIAHARLKQRGDRIVMDELLEPIELPDAALMTQAEVPKIYFDETTEEFLLLVSACDRRYEGQPDAECTHIHRLYVSRDVSGPWRPFQAGNSKLPGLENMFGASLLSHDLERGRFEVLGPYTENAGPAHQLRFAAPVTISTTVDAST